MMDDVFPYVGRGGSGKGSGPKAPLPAAHSGPAVRLRKRRPGPVSPARRKYPIQYTKNSA